MDIIDKMFEYMRNREKGVLITTGIQISDTDLNVVVIKVLSWLKLEHKRSIWISEGKKNCLKPLEIDVQYPWCFNLCMMVEQENLFKNYFSIQNGKFDFADSITENDRVIAREKAFSNYNPQKHT